ncbi:JAB domain-containing protein [Daejeonella sp.]
MLEPLDADMFLTMKTKKAAKLMDIQLLDHLILSTGEFCSFVDDGIL